MIWLLTEIFVFVAAAALFGGLIGLGLAGTGAKRRVVAFEREHKDLIEKVETYERTQRAIEGKAVARAAAEAAARGDLESRLVEMETAAADYRARAEAAERRLHVMDSPGAATTLVEEAAPVASEVVEAADGPAEIDLRGIEAERDAARHAAEAVDRQTAAARALQAQEIESLKAQLAAAERGRARAESDLAVAQARGDRAPAPAARAEPNGDPPPLPNPDLVANGEKPEGLAAPRGGRADDLRRIRGIGPKNEGVLNALGLYHYEQIAALTPENVAWLDAYLKFHGRIARDDWVGQAKMLVDLGERPSDKVHPQDAGA